MTRSCNEKTLFSPASLTKFGLSKDMLQAAIAHVHDLLDGIDRELTSGGGNRLAELVELANLSAIIGNLFRAGITTASDGKFAANRPHTYPDLVAIGTGCKDVEIKVALEGNNPKGHLVKPGPHLIVRYVLAEADGTYKRGREHRGGVVWIWEVRVGSLQGQHFNFSNTEGDSGKTAVINAAGMAALSIAYCDLDRCPLSPKNAARRKIADAVA